MTSRGRILIAEDDPAVSGVLSELLAEKGYEPVATETVAEAKRLLDAHHFDLAVVDLGLKDGSGHEVVRHIRASAAAGAMPVIMLTGAKALDDMERSLEAGVDYFLSKPMAAAELVMWVRSLLRRVHDDWDRGTTIGVPGLRLNPDIRTVWVDDVVVRGLTAKEFDILLELSVAAPSELTARELSRRVWGREPASNTLAVHVKSLRRKLGLKGGARVATTPDGYILR